MKYEPVFNWSKEEGTTVCAISDGKNTFYGMAHCHPDDADMMSEKTGCEIAYRRACIKAYKHSVSQLKERLAALNQLYYSMKHSKNFNSKSYENKMLQRQIRLIKSDLAAVKEMIVHEELGLNALIVAKEEFYKAIRKQRQARAQAKVNS